jgi:hypothetical protein
MHMCVHDSQWFSRRTVRETTARERENRLTATRGKVSSASTQSWIFFFFNIFVFLRLFLLVIRKFANISHPPTSDRLRSVSKRAPKLSSRVCHTSRIQKQHSPRPVGNWCSVVDMEIRD